MMTRSKPLPSRFSLKKRARSISRKIFNIVFEEHERNLYCPYWQTLAYMKAVDMTENGRDLNGQKGR